MRARIAYHNGDRVVPDALVVVDDPHPLQRHEPAVGVAIHHLRAHVLRHKTQPQFANHGQFHRYTDGAAHPIHRLEEARQAIIGSYLDLRPGGGSGAGRAHHLHHAISHLATGERKMWVSDQRKGSRSREGADGGLPVRWRRGRGAA